MKKTKLKNILAFALVATFAFTGIASSTVTDTVGRPFQFENGGK